MKGLSVLFTLALLVTAHLLAVQLRRARALPAQHSAHGHLSTTAAARPTPRPPLPANATFEL